MEGSITTYNEMRTRQEEDHPDWVPALSDLLFLEHGMGSDRNRVFTLEEVRNLIQTLFTEIVVNNGQGGTAQTTITPGEVFTYAGTGFKVRMQGGMLLNITGRGIFVYSDGEMDTLLGSLVYDSTNHCFKFDSDLTIDASKSVTSDGGYNCGPLAVSVGEGGVINFQITKNGSTTSCILLAKELFTTVQPVEHRNAVTFKKGAVLPRKVASSGFSLRDDPYKSTTQYPIGSVLVVENDANSAINVYTTYNSYESIPVNSSQMFYRRYEGSDGGQQGYFDSGWIVVGRRFSET